MKTQGVVKSVMRFALSALVTSAILGVVSGAMAASGFNDPLDTPAKLVTKMETRPYTATTAAGKRLVAVGLRGLIAVSDDQGRSWSQRQAPVQSDLLAVQFPTDKSGWVVGHDGVILHSDDGGDHWSKQLDGRVAANLFKKFYENSDGIDFVVRKNALAQIDSNYKAGPALPFLDVWFDDDQTGFVVGSFGLIAMTHDAGKTWEPGFHRIDNPQSLNLNSIRRLGGSMMIVAERGHIFKYEPAQAKFIAINTGYQGSFFGLVGADKVILAYGLRGTVYKSVNSGLDWEAIEVPTRATLNHGVVNHEKTGFVLLDNSGRLLFLDRQGASPRLLLPANSSRLTSVLSGPGNQYLLAGLDGIHQEILLGKAE